MHLPTQHILELLRNHGLLLLLALAILEGPIVSVIAGWLVRLGYLQFASVVVVCIVADLIGDGLLYCIGRAAKGVLPDRMWRRFRASTGGEHGLLEHFQKEGGRILIIGKLTHSLGFAALMGAGAARMPLLSFFWYNLVATVPKSLFFVVLGYALGEAYTSIDTWIWRGSLIMFVVTIAFAVFWLHRLRHRLT